MTPAYTSLHSHTIFSSLDGHSLVEDYVATVNAFGHTHAAITDHGTLAGVPEFVASCTGSGIIPIVGMEAYVEPGDCRIRDNEHAGTYHLTLLAQNATGYHNLMQLATIANSEGFYRKPRVDWELLHRHHEGLICLSGCVAGELPRAIVAEDEAMIASTLDFYTSTFGERYFLEWQNHGTIFAGQQQVNRRLYELAKTYGLQSVATNDSHFCHQEDFTAQQLLIGIKRRQKVEEVNSGSKYCFVRSDHEMRQAFADAPLLRNTMAIAAMIESYPLGSRVPKLPTSPLEHNGAHPDHTLRVLARVGLEQRCACSYPQVPPVYHERLEMELDVVHTLSQQLDADFSRYLLMIADITTYCRSHQIRFGPRGSAAGSVICWALGISEPDPITNGLFFERFLNPYRVELPDVDLDFADDRREDVFRYIRDTYGEANVAKIGTYAKIGAKQAIKDAAASVENYLDPKEGSPRYLADQLIRLIPDDPRPGGIPLNELWTDAKAGKTFHEAVEAKESYTRIISNALKIEGRTRGDGMHAGGVVICDRPIASVLPLAWTNQARKEKDPVVPFQTQYEMQWLESLGLLKVDILGLKTLSVLDAALQRINSLSVLEQIDPWQIPWDDGATWDLIKSGRTLSLFQIGSEGLGGACFQLQPDSIEDLALTVAVYRPGPMKNFKKIVARKHGLDPLSSIHPAIDPLLATTYGFPIYQEQIMAIARDFAGYSLGEADLLRKAMGKKIREKMALEQQRFLAGAQALGHSEAEITQVWDFIVPFADYGFNRAHAICYAYVAYQTAYLKANYPQSFYSAALTVEITTGGSDTPQQRIGQLAREANTVTEILPPSVQSPTVGFEVESTGIRYGLAAVKNVGPSDAEAIVAARQDGPFTGILDFMVRCPTVKRGVIESLVRAGAIPWANRASLVEKFELIGPRGGKREVTQVALLVTKRTRLKTHPELFAEEEIPLQPEWSDAECLLNEQTHLGIFTTPLPTSTLEITTIEQLTQDEENSYEDQQVVMMGILTKVKHTVTRRNHDTMGYGLLLDETGADWNLIFFHRTYETVKDELFEGNLVYVSGKVKTDDVGVKRLIATAVWKVRTEPEAVVMPPPLLGTKIIVPDADALNFLTEIYTLALAHPGEATLELVYGGSIEILLVDPLVLQLLAPRLAA